MAKIQVFDPVTGRWSIQENTSAQVTFDGVASEILAIGDIVNVWDDAGDKKVRKANASDYDHRAMGVAITAAAAIGDTAKIGSEAIVTPATIAVNADGYAFLAVVGGMTDTAPSTAAQIVQVVGQQVNDTQVRIEIDTPYELA